MLNVIRVERQIGGRTLSIETGKIAKQSDGAVVVQYGGTVVLVAAVSSPSKSKEMDYFPLSVDYRERHCAAGKFPGGFIKREGRPSTKETLTSRMIDRPIRPLFPDGYYDEVQILANVLSFDGENDPDILSMVGASAALTISKIPFLGPMGSCRICRIKDEYIVNPTHKQVEESDMCIILGGRKEAINMIEVDAKEVSESVICEGIKAGHEVIIQVCDMITELREKAGVEKEVVVVEEDKELISEIESKISDKLYEIKRINEKQERNNATKGLYEQLEAEYCSDEEGKQPRCEVYILKRILEKVEGKVVKKMLLEGKRPDGRGYDEIRPIQCEVGILPRTHGSALFSRGETQALVNVTLGTVRDGQIVDSLLEEYSENFMLHYNFPPYSVGEVRPMRGPGRREIGHGALAEKALRGVKPSDDQFAYTIRVVSDITESNGSSSMASVCGGSLALMDAGVPVKGAVAGISIGLITGENGEYRLLTDIIGEEDHYGEMDFKVAGTVNGITAIQLDIKAEGLPHNIMVEALEKAKTARLKILDIMSKVISQPKSELSEYAPKMLSIKIDPELIGKLIGPGGKMIKSIQEQTGSLIEIEEDGTVFVSCFGGNGHLKAKEIIEDMTTPPKVGRLYANAKVVAIKDFGAFVEISPGVEGLCHISELSDSYVKNVEGVCKVGDVIPVKLIAIDEQGRLKLSRKVALAELEKAEKS